MRARALVTGTLCALLLGAAPSLGNEPVPRTIAQLPKPAPTELVSEPIELLPATDEEVARRLGLICDTALRARVLYERDGSVQTANTGAFAFYQPVTGEYLLVGVPPDAPMTATLAIEVEDGVRATLVERLSPSIALTRVEAGAVPILREVVLGEYAQKMAVPKYRLQQCDELGARVLERGKLLPDEEMLAVDCEHLMEYRGPETVFSCPVTGGARTWSFLDVYQNRYILLDDDSDVAPLQYRGFIKIGTGAQEWNELLGLPVFDPTGDKNAAFGVIIGVQRINDHSWGVLLSSAEAIIPFAYQQAVADATKNKPLKTAGDSPVKAAP